MLANYDLMHLLTFPIKDDVVRKQFLIGTLVYLAGFIVPILPLFFVTGFFIWRPSRSFLPHHLCKSFGIQRRIQRPA